MTRLLLYIALSFAPVGAVAQTRGVPVPLPTVPNGFGAGSDGSGAAPTIGNVLATCTVRTPGGYRFQNQSPATLQMVLDDGASATPTIFVYGSGGGAGSQGGDSSPELRWFTGRIRIAGAAGSQFALRCN